MDGTKSCVFQISEYPEHFDCVDYIVLHSAEKIQTQTRILKWGHNKIRGAISLKCLKISLMLQERLLLLLFEYVTINHILNCYSKKSDSKNGYKEVREV